MAVGYRKISCGIEGITLKTQLFWKRPPLGCLRSVRAGPSPQANLLTPAAIISRLSAWIYSITASCCVDGSKLSGRYPETRNCGKILATRTPVG